MNFNHDPSAILCAGMKGTGKTTALLNLLRKSPARWKFVFDPNLEVARKLGWQAASTPEGLSKLFDGKRPVVFYPGEMFPGDRLGAFDKFCRFVLAMSKRRDGPKLLCADELQGCTSKHWSNLSPAFKEIIDEGRREELDVLMGAQSVNSLCGEIQIQLTELFVFKHVDTASACISRLEEMGISREELLALPHPKTHGKVGWIHRDMLTGEKTLVIHKCT